MTIGKNIKKFRKEINMTQEELGKAIGVGKQAIQKYENEIVTNIPYDRIISLAKVLRVSPAKLMGFEEEEPDTNGSEDAELLKKYHSLSSEQQQVVMSMIDSLLKK